MGEPAANIQDASMEDLAAQIESLLGTAESAAPPPAHAPVHPTDKSGLPHHAPAPEEGDMEPEDLGAAVEKMLAQAMAQVEELGEASTAAAKEIPFHLPEEAPAPPAEEPAASLEDELTALAEQLDAQPAPAPASAAPAPEPHAEAPNEDPGSEAALKVAAKPEAVGKAGVVAALAAWSSQDRNKIESQAAPPAEHEPAASEPPKPAAPAAAAPAPTTVADAPATATVPAPVPKPAAPRTPWLKPLLIKSARALGKPVVVVAEVTVNVLAKPLAGAKPVVRDSVGWIAVVTLFMGGCMWAAVLLRNPKPFVPAIAPVTLVAAGEGGEGGGHGGAKSGGGHKEAKPAGHGEAKGGHDKKPAAKKEEAKAEGHGGGGAAKPPVKREPLIQRGPAGAKKPAKKAEGHGEGHG